MAASSSSSNCVFDVFPSFSGEDVRKGFLSHFLRELDRKLIIAFKDNEIERSRSLGPELTHAIRSSRIAVVIFSENYASSSWCLDELLEIVNCKQESGQMVIPVFYGLDPSHVRKHKGKFGEAFEKTCKTKTEEETQLWRQALTVVANLTGYPSDNWVNESKMIEAIANDVLGKLNITLSEDFEDFVGLEDHISEMSLLLHMESEEVRMVGIWGTSGIGKTTIARVLYSRISRLFESSVFIDRAFVSKSMEIYNSANPDDYNMKLHLQETFLSEVLDKKDFKINRLGAVRERLKNRKVLIFIDDLDNQVVLDTLAGQTQWFGCGSRIVVVTKDKHILRAHGIEHIYNVCLPSKQLALKMFCRSAFKKNSPPDGFLELASEVASHAGELPLGLNVLGSYLRGRDKEDWLDMLPRLRDGLDGKIERTLRVSYDGLGNKKDQALFRHIACLFNGEKVSEIKRLLADSNLDVNIGLKNLVDKSLIHVREDIVEMHHLLQEMGKEIVRAQSDEPGEREFLVDSRDICDLLEDNTGTKNVLGISLDIDETDEVHIHKNAFKVMRNLRFLKILAKQKREVIWHLPEGFDHFPPKLKLLSWERYPLRCMPSNFRPENLVKLHMQQSNLEKLWDGVPSLTGLMDMNLQGSVNIKEIPNLSMATNLENLDLSFCSSLVELPSSVKYLTKLEKLNMSHCVNLETLPTGINLQSLYSLDFDECSRLKIFPDISTNISQLFLHDTSIDEFLPILHLKKLTILGMYGMKSEKIWEGVQPLTSLMTILSPSLERLFLSDIPSLVEIPSCIENFSELQYLKIIHCINLETLPTGINLPSLLLLELRGCSRMRVFPDISTNITHLDLRQTWIEEVPWWIEKFSRLRALNMSGCQNLQYVSLHIFKLKNLVGVDFSNCGALTKGSWNESSSSVAVDTYSTRSKFSVFDDAASSSFLEIFINYFSLNQEVLLQRQPVSSKYALFSGEEVPSYYPHQTTGTTLTNIPLLHTSQSQPFCRFKACVLVDSRPVYPYSLLFDIHVSCRFKGRLGKHFDSAHKIEKFDKYEKGTYLVVFDCYSPLDEDNASLAELYYDHVDLHIHVSNISSHGAFKLKGWGIRIFNDFSAPDK